MEINRNSAASVHECDGGVIREHQPGTPDVSTSLVGVDSLRHPENGWIEVPFLGVAILRGMRRYVDLIRPDSELSTVRLHPGDEATIEGGERFALTGTGEVLVINSPALPHDQVKYVQ